MILIHKSYGSKQNKVLACSNDILDFDVKTKQTIVYVKMVLIQRCVLNSYCSLYEKINDFSFFEDKPYKQAAFNP